MKCWLIIIKYIFVFAISSLYTQLQMHVQLFVMLIKHIDKEPARNTDRERDRRGGGVGRALPVWMEVVKQSVNARVYFPSAVALTQASFMWLTHGYTVTLTHLDTHSHTPWPPLSTAHTERIHMKTQPLSSSAASTARLHDSCSTAVFFNHQLNTYNINAFTDVCIAV